MLFVNLCFSQFECRSIRAEVYMLIHRIECLRCAQEQGKGFVVDIAVDLFGHLSGVIRSVTSNLAEEAERRPVEVEGDATVRDSALLPGSLVRSDAVVEHSVVGERAVVGEGTRLSDLTVVGGGTVVDAGQQLVGGRVR